MPGVVEIRCLDCIKQLQYISKVQNLIMARANGYIIAKQFQKEGDNFEVSMDISADNRMLAFGYGPMIKLVSLNTDVNFWFQDRKTLGKLPIFSKDNKQKINIPNSQRVVRDLKWNQSDAGKNFIGVAMGESAFVYDVQDIQSSKTPEGFIKVFETDDVMRQGDYPTKFIWYPNSKDIFLCTSSKSDEIVMRDLRKPEVVSTFNGNLSDSKNQQKIEDLKFNPGDANIFATISKHSTIQIFDIRKPSKSISKCESVIQNYKSNLIDWEWNGHRLVSAFGGWIKIWSFDGQELVQKQSFEHKNAISDFKWMRRQPQYLFVSEMQENIVYGYRINKQKHDIEILVDPRHSGLKKFITDRNEELLLGLINFEDSKKYHHEMIAVFVDYKSSQIWSKTKFKKPNQFGLDNQLLFAATRMNYQNPNTVDSCYALLYKQVQSFARKVAPESTQTQKSQEIDDTQSKIILKNKLKLIKSQHKQLKRQIKQRKAMQNKGEESHEKIVEKNKIKKSTSIEDRNLKQDNKIHKSLQKLKLDKKQSENCSSSSQQEQHVSHEKSVWIQSFREEVQYLDKNYRIQITNENKGQSVCYHNSKVAKRIGKDRCAQFWRYIYFFAFPEVEEKYNLSGLYQDKVKIDVHFKDNKIIANCENKSQMLKKTTRYNVEKLIQNLVDENQLQTAVMASIMIRNKDPKVLTLQFIEPFLVCYKEMLKAMGLTFISTNLSFNAKLNEAIPSAMFSFEIPIGCGQCYRKFSDQKCTCLQVCVICGESLRSSLVIGCKICGHMAHAREYEKRIMEEGNQKCPYDQCHHQCFKV